jgi:hypothetical protein
MINTQKSLNPLLLVRSGILILMSIFELDLPGNGPILQGVVESTAIKTA